MNNCLNCSKSIESHTGRRPKRFCSDKCRIQYHNKNKAKNYVKRGTYEAALEENKALKKELEDIKSRQIVEVPKKQPQNASDVKIQNFTERPKTNYSIDTTKNDEIERLTAAMNNCANTPLGKKARESYQKQIDKLKNQLK